METTFALQKDGRSTASEADLRAKFDFLIGIRDKLTEIHTAIKEIRVVRSQIKAVTGKLDDDEHEAIKSSARELTDRITAIEEALYQTKNQSAQDPLNFPIRLNNKLVALAGNASVGNYRPTDQHLAVRDNLVSLIDIELAAWRTIVEQDVSALNLLISNASIPAITLENR